MIDAIRNALRIPDLRRKIIFTLSIIALYRVGAHVPVPGVDPASMKDLVSGAGSALGLLNLFAGGALENFAIFALGIMPYITATIIMQLLQAVIPTFERWSKEGEAGQRKITQTARYMTLGIALMESLGLLTVFQAPATSGGLGVQFNLLTEIVIVISLISGTAAIMWMGELITQRGIGNGMSLLIFASIVSRFPQTIVSSFRVNPWFMLLVLAISLLVVAAVVFMEGGQRRIPIQYAKRVVGRRVYGGMGTYIPLKVNGANVIPIIFASSVLLFPSTIARFFTSVEWLQQVAAWLSGGWTYIALFAVMIVFFSYFYTALVFNPIETADNLRKNGGFIPGVRPGNPTAQYITNVLNRITLPGAVFLAAIAVVPQIIFQQTGDHLVQAFGGTSILIMVGVALETMRQLESQLQMRHYDGFFK
ncbi:MAG TPA: preprotein translocase subunit SecY [Actinobacteria bacterium]|nr:preprotein translocase subunit SecY [Actinomycetota bacterium]